MQDSKTRRGRRPIVTVLDSERRFPGGREFRFAPAQQGEQVRRAPLSATMTARAFAWRDDDAANDASFAPSGAGAANEASRVPSNRGPANAPALSAAQDVAPETRGVENGAPRDDTALADLLRDLRRVYRAPRGGRVPRR